MDLREHFISFSNCYLGLLSFTLKTKFKNSTFIVHLDSQNKHFFLFIFKSVERMAPLLSSKKVAVSYEN